MPTGCERTGCIERSSTVVLNQFVNESGITCFHRLSNETGAGAPM